MFDEKKHCKSYPMNMSNLNKTNIVQQILLIPHSLFEKVIKSKIP